MSRPAPIGLGAALAIAGLLAGPPPVCSDPAGGAIDRAETRERIAEAVTEASLRFGVPADWIRAVIRVESLENPYAVSAKGAVGLMQLMPSTYDDLRAGLGLGADPFDIHDNVAAGAAYMRRMFDRYGRLGMIGAYNAGPGRWEAHLSAARSLPAETVDYLTKLAPALGAEAADVRRQVNRASPRWPADAPMFASLASSVAAMAPPPNRPRAVSLIAAVPPRVQQSAPLLEHATPVVGVARSSRDPDLDAQRAASPDEVTAPSHEAASGLFVRLTRSGAAP